MLEQKILFAKRLKQIILDRADQLCLFAKYVKQTLFLLNTLSKLKLLLPSSPFLHKCLSKKVFAYRLKQTILDHAEKPFLFAKYVKQTVFFA